mmetsp:Transcript_39219/g.85304  ORF Transcript_39219/g.85304 Transcript_39219/m.85304 type:complete len:330 (-) Transcript_39219:429-1418(-)|eukprot:CAMPEP_0118955402 /NCGR_PEP_ID=MMETSP1169-20130426/59908_1 /TAXON_ID=36882 /ORGANISM="Pyramimonas obovata, Strain CCMP722" /LENGTH=329 /DNA_ID=CAMNT_0006903241 /DNA_START=257 /DNA_END=1246 /DNA_ORIENTATION=-
MGRAPLNSTPEWTGEVRSADAVALALQMKMLSLQGEFLAEDGTEVDYAALQISETFEEYKDMTRELQKVELSQLDVDQRKCFFLNLYNALTVHGISELADWQKKPPNSPLDIVNFWSDTAYQIGPYAFTLDEIEHGILRGNRPHPGPGRKLMFKESDPRAQLVVPLDCRIHFALVCGAKSCPAIRIYKVTNLERGLQGAARNFLDQEVMVDSKKKTIFMSKILDWYSMDFGDTQVEVLQKLCEFMSDGPSKDALSDIIEKDKDDSFFLNRMTQSWRYFSRWILRTQLLLPGPITVHFKEYNWSLNKKDLSPTYALDPTQPSPSPPNRLC